jgi:hypothetical protein
MESAAGSGAAFSAAREKLPDGDPRMKNMKDRWQRVWQELGAATVPRDVLGELIRAYSAPERYYHNLAHIRA